jgi:hypothetical protein
LIFSYITITKIIKIKYNTQNNYKMKKLNFATTLTETQSYIGELAGPYVLASFMQNKTVDSGIKVISDIILAAYVAKLSGSNLVQVGKHCNFSPKGTIVASEVKLTPCEFFIDLELCYEDLEALWNGLSNGNLNTQDPGADFNSALQKVLIDAMNQAFETAIWQATGGTTGNTGNTWCSTFSGITSQITNSVSGATTLTKSNVVAAVDSLIAKLPAVVLEDPSQIKIYMNPKTLMFYKQALMSLGVNTPATDQASTYDGLPIYTVVKIPDNVMVAIQPSNIALGVGAMDNFSQLIVKDMRESTLDNKFRMKIQGKADVKVIYPAEAAKYVG